MSRAANPLSANLPYLQERLSALSVSDWMHQLTLAVARVEDFTAGPLVLWTESAPWGWVTWALDTTYGFDVPRPDTAEPGQLFVHTIVLPDPSATTVSRAQIRSYRNPTYLYRPESRPGHMQVSKGSPTAQFVGPPIQMGYGVGGVAGFVGGGGLVNAVGATSLIHPLWAGIAGGLAGAAGWATWRHRGQRHLRTWRESDGDPDVPLDVAAVDDGRRLLATSNRILDSEYRRELARQLDQYRWNIIDPDQVDRTRANLERTIEELNRVHATAQQIAGETKNTRTAIAAELAQAYPVDTGPDDGVAERLRVRTDAVRELHGLHPLHRSTSTLDRWNSPTQTQGTGETGPALPQ